MTLHAGWAYDAIAWLRLVRSVSFGEHLAYGHHNGLSHYQLTQLVIWTLHRIFGAADLPYFLIHTGIHALNATLLFGIVRRLLSAAGNTNATPAALLTAGLFLLSPTAGEVVVYKAAFHYGFAHLLLLACCSLCVSYLQRLLPRTAWIAAVIYAASLFTLELSYLTPFFCLAIILWYFRLIDPDRKRLRDALLRISLPQFTLLGTLFVVNFLSQPASGASLFQRPPSFFAIKPPLFVLHLLWGRFLPQSWRDAWLQLFCTYTSAALFYASLLVLTVWAIRRIKRFSSAGKLAVLGAGWMFPAAALCALMWFPEKDFIYCDRYLYPLLAGAAVVTGCGIYTLRSAALRNAAIIATISISITCTLFNNYLWWQSARIMTSLQRQAPALARGNRVLLLNSPWSFRGAPMVFPGAESGFAAIAAQKYGHQFGMAVDEVMSFNMRKPDYGARVQVIDDTTLLVTLNQPGGWVRNYDPAINYETPVFRAALSGTQQYRLTLKDTTVSLWFQSGDQLREVDMRIRDQDQR